jgi:Ca2+-binding EF-hand superfamily protein
MKHKITISMMALGLALPVMNLHAQDEARPARGPRGNHPGGPAFLAAVDANKDGKLDKDEITASSDALKKLDKDSDGKITVAELRGAPGRGPRGDGGRPQRPEGADRPSRQESEANAGPRPAFPPLLAALDTNKSGAIDTDELAGAPAAFLKLDKNSDGELSAEEMRIGRGPRGPRAGNDDDNERPRREGPGPREAQNTPQE